jgi:hypothetical protein
MKKTKERFDTLIQRIQKGEKVKFGEMETLFAQAFLSRFLQRLEAQSRKQTPEQKHEGEEGVEPDEEREYDEDYDNQDYDNDEEEYDENGRRIRKIPRDAQIRQELEMTRSVMGTLGVRPTTQDLSHYIEFSIQQRDWTMLSDVLGLTAEGSMGEGVIEKIALEDLVRGRDKSYKELKEHFGELRFTQEAVDQEYARIVQRRDFQAITRIREATSIPVPQQTCQAEYERMLENYSDTTPETLLGLYAVSGNAPAMTKAAEESLAKAFSEKIIAEEETDTLDKLFDIYKNRRHAIHLQRAALEGDKTAAFRQLYRCSEAKIPAHEIRARYKRLSEEDKILDIFELICTTEVAPERTVLNNIYNRLFEKQRYSELLTTAQKTQTKPHLEPEKVMQEVQKAAAQANGIESINTNPRIIQTLKILELDKEHADKTAIRQLGLDLFKKSQSAQFDTAYQTLSRLYSEFSVEMPEEVTTMAVTHIGANLETALVSLTSKHHSNGLSPLDPVHRINTKEYNKFKSEAKKTAKEHAKKAEEIRQHNKNAQITDSEPLQRAYTRCIELTIVQCDREEDGVITIDDIQEAFGVEISEASKAKAIENRIKSLHRPQHPENLLEKVQVKTGISMALGDESKNRLAREVLTNTNRRHESLEYLLKLTGQFEFSEQTKEHINGTMTRALTEGKIEEYDGLAKYLGRPHELTELGKENIRIKARSMVTQGRSREYYALLARVPEAALAREDIIDIATNMISDWRFDEYNTLKNRFNLTEEFSEAQKNKIREETIAKVKLNPQTHTQVSRVNQHAKMTVTATPEELRKIVDAAFRSIWSLYPAAIAKSLNQELDRQQIEKKYIEILERNNANWDDQEKVRRIRENTGISITDSTVEEFLRYKYNRKECIEWVSVLHRCAGYTPGEMMRERIFNYMYDENSHEGMQRIATVCGAKPSDEYVRSKIILRHTPIGKRVKWLSTFNKITGFTPNEEETEQLYRDAAAAGNENRIGDISQLIDITGRAPPEETSQEVIAIAMRRPSYSLTGTSWGDNWSLFNLLQKLTGKYKVQLSEEQKREMTAFIAKSPDVPALAERIQNLEQRYATKAQPDETQQKTLLEMIERTVAQEAYSRIAKTTSYPAFYFEWESAELFTSEEVKKQAAQRSAQLLASEDIYQGFVYTLATGVMPAFTPEQAGQFKSNLATYERRFGKSEIQKKTVKKLSEKWLKGGQ